MGVGRRSATRLKHNGSSGWEAGCHGELVAVQSLAAVLNTHYSELALRQPNVKIFKVWGALCRMGALRATKALTSFDMTAFF